MKETTGKWVLNNLRAFKFQRIPTYVSHLGGSWIWNRYEIKMEKKIHRIKTDITFLMFFGDNLCRPEHKSIQLSLLWFHEMQDIRKTLKLQIFLVSFFEPVLSREQSRSLKFVIFVYHASRLWCIPKMITLTIVDSVHFMRKIHIIIHVVRTCI